MQRTFFFWELGGALFVIAVGSLLHFVFDWSGKNPVVGLFTPINESTWEHLKLLFFPMLAFSILEFCMIGREFPGFLLAKSAGIFAGLLAIIILFYTYTGIVGTNYLWADILTFVFGVLIAYTVSWRISAAAGWIPIGYTIFALLMVFCLLFCFLAFTVYPPYQKLFLDPVTQSYGIHQEKADTSPP